MRIFARPRYYFGPHERVEKLAIRWCVLHLETRQAHGAPLWNARALRNNVVYREVVVCR